MHLVYSKVKPNLTMLMKIELLYFIFSIFHLLTVSSNTDDVNYYKNLIFTGIENFLTYRSPQDAGEYRPYNEESLYYGTYDFVIIGGGSAGAVIASRLSEIYDWKILLLEAGIPGNNFTDIPIMLALLLKSRYNWGFKTVPQTTCCQATDGACFYPRGKALGGSSTINGMMYVRGNKLDFDRWGSEGNPGWYYEDVLPFFKKSENSEIFGSNFYHGEGGYLNVEYHNPISNKSWNFLDANIEIGIPIGDYNGKEQLVSGLTQFTTIDGRRMSTEKAFLYPAKNRSNLDVLTNSYVTKIVVEERTKTATGVIFSHNRTKYLVNITKEVILSAGVIGSPQILMLSGIGPADHLTEHAIPVIKNLSVGLNFHDHVSMIGLMFRSTPESLVNLTVAVEQYLHGKGPLTIPNNALGYYRLYANNSDLPEFEITIDPLPDVSLDIIGGNPTNGDFAIIPMLLHPKSRGQVNLNSSDPYEYPLIGAKCLADPHDEDLKGMLKGIDQLFTLLETDTFRTISPQLIPNPACLNHTLLTTEYWICVLRQIATVIYHGGGTCKMGPGDKGVVSNKLKVYGIENLRVADASVVPFPLSGHMNAPVIMVGERAAEFIKDEYL